MDLQKKIKNFYFESKKKNQIQGRAPGAGHMCTASIPAAPLFGSKFMKQKAAICLVSDKMSAVMMII